MAQASTQTTPHKNAIRRLLTDLSDWKRNSHEFPCINAVPLESNIFEWHCNLAANDKCGQFAGLVIHLILIFPNSYPQQPPKVKLCTQIPHPNVLGFDGGYICLDMLRSYEQGNYKGWTPAYNVCSILMQLQSFLFEENSIDQDYGSSRRNKLDLSTVRQTIRRISNFKCHKCGHTWDNVFPSVKWFDRSLVDKVDLDYYTGNDRTFVKKYVKRGEKIKLKVTKDIFDPQETLENKLVILAINGNGWKEPEDTTKIRKRAIKHQKSSGQSKDRNEIKPKNAKTDRFLAVAGNDGDEESKEESKDERKEQNISLDGSFRFWNGIYYDVESVILSYFDDIRELLVLRRVSKQFSRMVEGSPMFKRNGIECWFHRASKISGNLKYNVSGYLKDGSDYNENMIPLCLGFGVTPKYYGNYWKTSVTTLRNQIFGSNNGRSKKYIENIQNAIGNYEMISQINTTFDLLSSDAFENYGVRKTVFKDATFTHFIPLYIGRTHGKLCMKSIEEYILRICKTPDVKAETEKKYHPFLAIYVIANIMKSLIVSVMQTSNNSDDGRISLHYSINVLETFFRYHHLLLAIYYLNKKKLKPLIQGQINMFFNRLLNNNNDNSGHNGNNNNQYFDCRNKQNIPDFGVFLMYLTLWEHDLEKDNLSWNEIGCELLDETFARQVKWVLNRHPNLIKNRNFTVESRELRIQHTWEETLVSRRLFMFQYFFLKHVCQLFGSNMTPKLKYFEYNTNFGQSKDKSLPIKLQNYVKRIHKCKNYKEFFQIIDIKYPGNKRLSNWLLDCVYQSERSLYHKPYVYYSILKKQSKPNKDYYIAV